MTREEAEYYKPCSTCYNDKCVWKGTKDTHLICEDYKSINGDNISRQATLYGLASIAKAKAKSDAQKSLMGRAMFLVEQMPSVQPKTDVLDKIRAEIEQHRRKTQSIDPYDLVGDCLEIIDKYMAESEEEK